VLSFDVIWGLALDRRARIYAIDAARIVRVFDTSGALVRTIGRPGQGPGEISAGIGIALSPDEQLWVADPGAQRYTIFDSAGHYDTTVRRPFVGGAVVSWRGRFTTGGQLLDQDLSMNPPGRQTDVVLRLSPSTGRFDSLAVLSERVAEFTVGAQPYPRAPVPYTPFLTWRADRSGCLWIGTTDQYRITKVCHGDSLLTIEKEWRPLPVADRERDSVLARLQWFAKAGGTIDRRRIPEHKPAFSAFWVDDDGYLWVKPYMTAGEEGRSLDVFAPSGRYLGAVPLDFVLARSRGPGVDPPFVVAGNLLVATTVDSDGVNSIVVAEVLGRL
jgi:hypothetical protein